MLDLTLSLLLLMKQNIDNKIFFTRNMVLRFCHFSMLGYHKNPKISDTPKI